MNCKIYQVLNIKILNIDKSKDKWREKYMHFDLCYPCLAYVKLIVPQLSSRALMITFSIAVLELLSSVATLYLVIFC